MRIRFGVICVASRTAYSVEMVRFFKIIFLCRSQLVPSVPDVLRKKNKLTYLRSWRFIQTAIVVLFNFCVVRVAMSVSYASNHISSQKTHSFWLSIVIHHRIFPCVKMQTLVHCTIIPIPCSHRDYQPIGLVRPILFFRSTQHLALVLSNFTHFGFCSSTNITIYF